VQRQAAAVECARTFERSARLDLKHIVAAIAVSYRSIDRSNNREKSDRAPQAIGARR
jgi:hypothetical protein